MISVFRGKMTCAACNGVATVMGAFALTGPVEIQLSEEIVLFLVAKQWD